MKEAIDRVCEEFETWEFSDQLVFTLEVLRLCKLSDCILAKYDGRNKRMKKVMELLKEDAT